MLGKFGGADEAGGYADELEACLGGGLQVQEGVADVEGFGGKDPSSGKPSDGRVKDAGVGLVEFGIFLGLRVVEEGFGDVESFDVVVEAGSGGGCDDAGKGFLSAERGKRFQGAVEKALRELGAGSDVAGHRGFDVLGVVEEGHKNRERLAPVLMEVCVGDLLLIEGFPDILVLCPFCFDGGYEGIVVIEEDGFHEAS